MEERIWHRAYDPEVPASLEYETLPLAAVLERAARNHPDQTALVMMGKKITYRELDQAVNRFARALRDLGIAKGDKIALILPNLPQTVIAIFAAFRLGAVVVMNNPLYTEHELAYQLDDSDSILAICLDLLVPRVLSVKSRTKVEIVMACHIKDYLPFPAKQLFPIVKKSMHRKIERGSGVLEFTDVLEKYPANPLDADVSFEDVGALLYTGGTTGVSKGVILTHRNLGVNAQQVRAWTFDAGEGKESVIAIFPFFHAAGFSSVLIHGVYRAFTNILVPRPQPSTVLDLTLKYKPSFFPCVPSIYVGLLNHPKFDGSKLSFIKGCVSGAAPLAVETLRQWEQSVGAAIAEVYGLTETAPMSHANPWQGTKKAGSAGVPLPDTDCRIVDLETGTKDLDMGTPGEILLAGPQVTQGYYKKPEETREAIRQGWFYTGDIGYMDDQGYLYIVDRKKDMIISAGYNIYPRDIDEVLYEHPMIREACAVGIPDAYRGETVKAFVVKREGAELTEEDVIAHCREKLAAYKTPRIVEFVEDLPKSNVGKVLRRKLREMELEKAREV